VKNGLTERCTDSRTDRGTPEQSDCLLPLALTPKASKYEIAFKVKDNVYKILSLAVFTVTHNKLDQYLITI